MIKILLVDDQNIFCQVLQSWLETINDFVILDQANNGQVAIEKVAKLKPDIVLIDIEMPTMDGIEATKIIAKNYPDSKVIILSSHDEDIYLANALKAGAKGYLVKNTTAEDLANTIRSVYRGYSQMSPGLLEKILTQVTPPVQETFDLKKSLNNFDPVTLQDLINHKLEDYNLLPQLQEILTTDPQNLAALYLTGILINRQQQDLSASLKYLELGYQEGIKQKLKTEHLLLFYQEAVTLNPEMAFRWLTQLNSPYNSLEGLSFLLQEADRLFGQTSPEYQNLLILFQIRTIASWQDRFTHLFNQCHHLVK